MARTAFRTCPLCEATCGLELTLSRATSVVKVRGDADDVFCHGFLCPKGVALKELHEDPDRLRTPLRPQRDGAFAPRDAGTRRSRGSTAACRRSLGRARPRRGRASTSATRPRTTSRRCSTAACSSRRSARATSSRPARSTSGPKQIASALMFGSVAHDRRPRRRPHRPPADPRRQPARLQRQPDDRARHARAPARDPARGGKVVVVDPRRTRTAEEADEHHFIRPGTDALLLFALVHVLFDEGLARPGRLGRAVRRARRGRALARAVHARGRRARRRGDRGRRRSARMARELAARRARRRLRPHRHHDAGVRHARLLARRRAQRRSPATSTGRAARCSRAPPPARRTRRASPGRGRGVAARALAQSRVRGLPRDLRRAAGRLPGRGDRDARRGPDPRADHARRQPGALDAELGPARARRSSALDFMVAFDIYVNETTRHADVILPRAVAARSARTTTSRFYQLVVRNVANYSPPVLAPEPGMPDEWETLLRLAGVVAGQGPDADVDAVRPPCVARARSSRPPRTVATPRRCWPSSSRASGPSGCSTCCCAPGPYDAHARRPRGRAARHRPRPARAAPAGGPAHAERQDRARARADRRRRRAPARRARRAARNGGMVLVGRRQLRSNNSWMHNLDLLVSGQGALHAARPPRRRRAARPRRRRAARG